MQCYKSPKKIPFDLGITIDTSSKLHQHTHNTVNKATGMANNLLTATCNHKCSLIITLLTSHIHPILESSSCVWSTGNTGDSKLLKYVQ